MGSSKKDLSAFPHEIKILMGYALHLAQIGEHHENTKILKCFGGAGVKETDKASSNDL